MLELVREEWRVFPSLTNDDSFDDKKSFLFGLIFVTVCFLFALDESVLTDEEQGFLSPSPRRVPIKPRNVPAEQQERERRETFHRCTLAWTFSFIQTWNSVNYRRLLLCWRTQMKSEDKTMFLSRKTKRLCHFSVDYD